MRPTDRVVLLALAATMSATAQAAPSRLTFDIPPASLDHALTAFSAQSGIDVGVAGTSVAREYSPGAKGRMSAAKALDRILSGTNWQALPVTGGGFRLVQKPPLAPVAARVPPRLPPRETVMASADDIVVTANKYGTSLLRFPGSVVVLARDSGALSVRTNRGLADALDRAPTVQGTALGNGRDKIFIRGIADSSFLGPTQSTTGVYFGDVQLGYNGSDPNLTLYDVDRVEVLEGPQGTLYGAGSVGGVIRISPREPEFDRLALSATVGGTATQNGSLGYDLAGMVNVPVIKDLAAIRLVGYRSHDGGYIDDVQRDIKNVNDSNTTGGRAALRLTPADGWTIDLGGVIQQIKTPDSQYGLRAYRGLARTSTIAQPFENDFYLGRLVVAKKWDNGLSLTSATGYMRSKADDRFDATLAPQFPLAYDTHNNNEQVTQEVRLTHTGHSGGGWVIGGNYLWDRDIITREYGPPNQERSIVGVINRTKTYSGFGELTLVLLPDFSVTGGVRITHARTDSDPSTTTRNSAFVRGRSETRADPSFGFSWRLKPRLAWFGRYGQGFRTGGLAVASGVGRVANFDPDTVKVFETGLRLDRTGPRQLAGSIALSRAVWHHIQADLVTARGFPYTANVGNGRIKGIEAQLDWSPFDGLRLNSGGFYAGTKGTDRPVFVNATRLPDTPRFSGVIGASWERPMWHGLTRLGITGRYVGSSYLDPGAQFDIQQGGYAQADLTASWQTPKLRIDVGLGNLTNSRGNRFALGNPFGVVNGDQYTPLRPRNLRIALTRNW